MSATQKPLLEKKPGGTISFAQTITHRMMVVSVSSRISYQSYGSIAAIRSRRTARRTPSSLEQASSFHLINWLASQVMGTCEELVRFREQIRHSDKGDEPSI